MPAERINPGVWIITAPVTLPDGSPSVISDTVVMDPNTPDVLQRFEAEKALAKLEQDIKEGTRTPDTPPPPPVLKPEEYTVRTFASYWMANEIKPNCSPVTYANYEYLLRSRINPVLGDVLLTQLTPVMLTNWLAYVRESPRKSTRLPDDKLKNKRAPSKPLVDDAWYTKPLSLKTLQNYFGCVDTMLEAAVRLEIIRVNPMNNVRRPTGRKKRPNCITEEEAVQLLRCLKDEPNMCFRCALLLALCCGLRLGEVCALKLSDVDWNKCTIDISRALKYTPLTGAFIDAPKTEAGLRVITLPAGMMTILYHTREYQEDCKALAPNVWVDEGWIVHTWCGGQVHHDTPSKWFRRFADKNGFEGVRFHDLRHTHASILLANNIDVVSVASRMGHSDPAVTLRQYAHALARRDRDAAQVLDDLFGAEMPT